MGAASQLLLFGKWAYLPLYHPVYNNRISLDKHFLHYHYTFISTAQ